VTTITSILELRTYAAFQTLHIDDTS